MAQLLTTEGLAEALERQDEALIAEQVSGLQAADLADFIRQEGQNEAELATRLLSHLPLSERARAFGYLDTGLQARLAHDLSPTALARLLSKMEADERADLFKLVEEDVQEAALRQMASEEREDLRRLASYQEGTAGALMTSDYVAIAQGLTVKQALQAVRSTAPDAETIYQVYIIDDERRLLGTVSLRELILALPEQSMDDLMRSELVTVSVDEDQEQVARQVSRYDLLALPVLDTDQRLVGIVTHDDAMDVAAEEATEDMHKAATIGKLSQGFGSSGLLELYRKRIVWLVLLVFANIFSGLGIAYFEDTIAAYIVLVFFLPLLVDSSGNAGSQAATLMVRGLATGDVRLADWGRHFGRELLVAGSLGLTMALAVSVLGVIRGGPDIALVVASSMIVVVVMGSLIGMSLPFLLNRLGWDPATASAPLVTSIADAVGVLIYFTIATMVLGLPA
ncbi:MAG: magnesium transporter [Natronospirillum sp.]|uniref:magnesium transporter n=1 Tax=Natronospirillum sp. TaxID=2812955 RepID=UPI0025F0A3D8|nr:magnesium transporter [Natronospirillum sp.]MCH8553052.1 magnesium transporter [Natronospirillum sp.]